MYIHCDVPILLTSWEIIATQGKWYSACVSTPAVIEIEQQNKIERPSDCENCSIIDKDSSCFWNVMDLFGLTLCLLLCMCGLL